MSLGSSDVGDKPFYLRTILQKALYFNTFFPDGGLGVMAGEFSGQSSPLI